LQFEVDARDPTGMTGVEPPEQGNRGQSGIVRRGYHSATWSTAMGRIYLLGGISGGRSVVSLQSVEPRRGDRPWVVRDEMTTGVGPSPRHGHAAVAIGEQLWVIGGGSGGDIVRSGVDFGGAYVLDLPTMRWHRPTLTQPAATARWSMPPPQRLIDAAVEARQRVASSLPVDSGARLLSKTPIGFARHCDENSIRHARHIACHGTELEAVQSARARGLDIGEDVVCVDPADRAASEAEAAGDAAGTEDRDEVTAFTRRERQRYEEHVEHMAAHGAFKAPDYGTDDAWEEGVPAALPGWIHRCLAAHAIGDRTIVVFGGGRTPCNRVGVIRILSPDEQRSTPETEGSVSPSGASASAAASASSAASRRTATPAICAYDLDLPGVPPSRRLNHSMEAARHSLWVYGGWDLNEPLGDVTRLDLCRGGPEKALLAKLQGRALMSPSVARVSGWDAVAALAGVKPKPAPAPAAAAPASELAEKAAEAVGGGEEHDDSSDDELEQTVQQKAVLSARRAHRRRRQMMLGMSARRRALLEMLMEQAAEGGEGGPQVQCPVS
jgi:hypothetical protein